jgi:hypothetical protein
MSKNNKKKQKKTRAGTIQKKKKTLSMVESTLELEQRCKGELRWSGEKIARSRKVDMREALQQQTQKLTQIGTSDTKSQENLPKKLDECYIVPKIQVVSSFPPEDPPLKHESLPFISEQSDIDATGTILCDSPTMSGQVQQITPPDVFDTAIANLKLHSTTTKSSDVPTVVEPLSGKRSKEIREQLQKVVADLVTYKAELKYLKKTDIDYELINRLYQFLSQLLASLVKELKLSHQLHQDKILKCNDLLRVSTAYKLDVPSGTSMTANIEVAEINLREKIRILMHLQAQNDIVLQNVLGQMVAN